MKPKAMSCHLIKGYQNIKKKLSLDCDYRSEVLIVILNQMLCHRQEKEHGLCLL